MAEKARHASESCSVNCLRSKLYRRRANIHEVESILQYYDKLACILDTQTT